MTIKRFSEPGFSNPGRSLEPYRFPGAQAVPVEFDRHEFPREFLGVLNKRKSERCFSHIELPSLAPLFYHTERTKNTFIHTCGSLLEKRNYGSPGSLYSVQSLLTKLDGEIWYRYNSGTQYFEVIELPLPSIQAFKNVCGRLVADSRHAWLIWYVCDYDLVSSKYTHPDTLIFRECGHLSATHSLVSEFLGLAYCALGYHGYAEAEDISSDRNFVGVGAALIGGRH